MANPLNQIVAIFELQVSSSFQIYKWAAHNEQTSPKRIAEAGTGDFLLICLCEKYHFMVDSSLQWQ